MHAQMRTSRQVQNGLPSTQRCPYAIAGTWPDSHMLTFRTTRDVQALYFDGTSASLMDDGSMDAQMLLIRNNSAHVPDHPRLG